MEALRPEDPRDVAGYRLHARLGEGGMGTVYLSYTRGGQPVALKLVRREFAQDPEFRRRFAREVTAARRVQGPYTAAVLDSNTEGPEPWLASSYVPGPSLAKAVAAYGPLPVSTALRLVAGVAEALHSIHSADVVHRDLKPSNVLLASDGPRVIDFGIARAGDATALTGTGTRLGTPGFMAPEQVTGEDAGPALDVYALGALAFFAATGRHPHGDGPGPALLYRIVSRDPDLTACPAELRELLTRCLARDPAERPRPTEVIDRCAELAGGEAHLRRADGWWLPERVAEDVAGQERTLRLVGEQGGPRPAEPATTGPHAPPPPPSTQPPVAGAPAVAPPQPGAAAPAAPRPATSPAGGPTGRVKPVVGALVGALLVAAASVGGTLWLTDDGGDGGGTRASGDLGGESSGGGDGGSDGKAKPVGEPRQQAGWRMTDRRTVVIEAPPYDPESSVSSAIQRCVGAKVTLVYLEQLKVVTNEEDREDEDFGGFDEFPSFRYVNCGERDYPNNGLKLLDGRGIMNTTDDNSPTPTTCRDLARQGAVSNPISVTDLRQRTVLDKGVGLCVETDKDAVVHLWVTNVRVEKQRDNMPSFVTTLTRWVPDEDGE